MDKHIFIDGFGIAGFRSFGEEIQRVAPCQKINLLVGQNNSGKSNILLFLQKYHNNLFIYCKENIKSAPKYSQKVLNFEDIDYHSIYYKYKENTILVTFGFSMNSSWISDYRNLISQKIRESGYNYNDNSNEIVNTIWNEILDQDKNVIWIEFSIINGTKIEFNTLCRKNLSTNLSTNSKLLHLWEILTGNIETSRKDGIYYMREILTIINPLNFIRMPEIALIPAIRKIGEAGSKPKEVTEENSIDLSGEGIIGRLAKLQHPSYSKQHLKDKFKQINEFLRTVTGNLSATIEIPSEEDMILVQMDNKTLPLSSLGTGIHEVIILAAAATILENQVLCIEEPELHLHPILQKKLIRYLQEKTSNQYFITTHSAHFLDTPDVGIFHITFKDGQSRVECISTNSKKSDICADLGYRASDLLQANCIIWVEGPSDRIYLNYWIKKVNSDLIEGIHYAIMFYGGKLLSHLSAADAENPDEDTNNDNNLNNFISLQTLNRYIAIIIDSDKKDEDDLINSTKQRIEEEFNQHGGFVWITKGREIENYINSDIIEEAVKKIHPGVEYLEKKGNYDNLLKCKKKDDKIFTADKVKVAREVIKKLPDLSILDLSEKVNELVKFIENANNL